MNVSPSIQVPAQLGVVLTLAQLLERLERTPGPVGAAQYRSVVMHLADELSKVSPGPGLQAVLDVHPAAAQVYENLNYQHAGLCRSPLEASLSAEMRAKEAIQRAARHESGESAG
jgi:hypothetical protein